MAEQRGMTEPRLKSQTSPLAGAARAKRWLVRDALPLWATAGVDPRGGFHERLAADGRADLTAPKRLRVQARQVFVYAFASRMGWFDGVALAERGAEFILDRARLEPGRPAYACLLTPDGGIADATVDTYDQVFVVFALASLFAATGDRTVLDEATAALAYLEDRLSDPVHGGFREAEPDREPRRQNPHMHAFETFLTLFEITGNRDHLKRADKIFTLFQERFFNHREGALQEHFESDWTVRAGVEGLVCEPGHEMEWCWLLHRYTEVSGVDTAAYSEALFRHADTYGRNRATGFLADQITVDGGALRSGSRLWPQTEHIKALCARSLTGCKRAGDQVDSVFDALFEKFLDTPVRGAWIDRRSADGAITDATAPASTFYHLIGAIAEADRAGLTGPAR